MKHLRIILILVLALSALMYVNFFVLKSESGGPKSTVTSNGNIIEDDSFTHRAEYGYPLTSVVKTASSPFMEAQRELDALGIILNLIADSIILGLIYILLRKSYQNYGK